MTRKEIIRELLKYKWANKYKFHKMTDLELLKMLIALKVTFEE